MSITPTDALRRAGVSIWLDDLSRSRLDSGSLAALIESHHVVGVTTNPTIFANAIGAGEEYKERIVASAARFLPANANAEPSEVPDLVLEDIVFDLMCADVADACDVFAEVFAASGGRDGRVSIEVSPLLARDTAGTIAQAKQLWAQVDRENAMVKIPATSEGLAAITEVTAAGISVNATLIFSLSRYRQVINAYLLGLERARAAGIDISRIHSVASIFVSRIDTAIDARLDAIASDEAKALRGQAALANARLAYEAFEQGFASERARLLLSLGGNLQRPLWASTGVKDPLLPDTLYVQGLTAPDSVNTMPEATLRAFADHGEPSGDSVTTEYRESDLVLNGVAALGVDYVEVMELLESEGLEKFAASWHELLAAVRQRVLQG